MARQRHPDAIIESALRYAEGKGWRVEKSHGHAHCWGRMYCLRNDRNCRGGSYCIGSIWSSPKSSENHARQIRRGVDGCIYAKQASEDMP